MTEAEWLTATDPTPMLESLLGRTSSRKGQLFVCAYMRERWQQPNEPAIAHAVSVAERWADGSISDAEVKANYEALMQALGEIAAARPRDHAVVTPFLHAHLCTHPDPLGVLVSMRPPDTVVARLRSLRYRAGHWLRGGTPFAELWPAGKPWGSIIRDIFGNPFRPVSVDPAWLTSTVVALANNIYAERAFDRMPILADALQDAGCDNADVLNHCRSDGPHVRGCWVVDLLLGKA
jgi:hypothetical protein